MRNYLAASFVALAIIYAAPAGAGESIWTHNGSTVRWVSSGQNRWIYYVEPRPGLAAIGVQPGTLLFEGRRIGKNLVGTAFVFNANCMPAPYPVEGEIYSETDVTLEGAVPVVDSYACDVLSHSWENQNASLRFRTIDRLPPVVARGWR